MNPYPVGAGEAERLGYHYTSAAALRKILREGLQPRPHPQLEKLGIHEPVIWLWPTQLRGRAHWGQLIWTMVRWGTPRVAVLAVSYDDEDVLLGESPVTHDGDMSTPYNTFIYHVNEPAVLLTRPVPQWRLRLAASYDLRKKVR